MDCAWVDAIPVDLRLYLIMTGYRTQRGLLR
jgi:hypothetical protein